jgi:organic hydroperoxide reductase OsmC/OhrA
MALRQLARQAQSEGGTHLIAAAYSNCYTLATKQFKKDAAKLFKG